MPRFPSGRRAAAAPAPIIAVRDAAPATTPVVTLILALILAPVVAPGAPVMAVEGAWVKATTSAATVSADAASERPPPSVPTPTDGGVAEPVDYRTSDYDTPVPDGLAGARTVTAVEVHALIESGAVVVDVVPAPRAPPTLPEGQLWIPPPHVGVPGALWLPDTGFGTLDAVTERYLLEHLERASGGDRERDLVFYCRMDCWMSWNAAKRARFAGYANVHWFRDGIDDWRFEGYPTETLVPARGERLPRTEGR